MPIPVYQQNMIILSAKEIAKSYGTDTILSGISFHVNEGDRVGLVGANGAGKTTLLKILAGDILSDAGDFFVAKNKEVGFLKQNSGFEHDRDVIDIVEDTFRGLMKMEEDLETLAEAIGLNGKNTPSLLKQYEAMQHEFEDRGGYKYKSEIKGVLSSMAFSEEMYHKKISTLSGGEKTRLALACLLLQKPDLLLLDEPTNHLDIGMLKWLEQYLKGYRGTIVVISHDRYFLNQVTTRTFEIENHRLAIYEGSYSYYADKKKILQEEAFRKYQSQQQEIHKQEDLIRKFKERGTEKLAKRAASREKRLSHLERMEKPQGTLGKIKIRFKEEYKSGRDVILAENLSKSFGRGQNRKELFQNVNLDVKRGERICIVGHNGIGKTTLLKIIMEDILPDSGYLKIGHNVAFGYYDQEQQDLNTENTVLEEVKSAYRLYSDTEMRSILGRFLFLNDMVFVKVEKLSGGEKARLSLVKLMLSGANVLIFDEPTNHLDIGSKEVFEEALLDFPGAVVCISHDRYFLNKVPHRILELEANGITEYLGKYDYYMEKKQNIQSGEQYLAGLLGTREDSPEEETHSEIQRRKTKEADAALRRNKKRLVKLQGDIEAWEREKTDIYKDMEEENVRTNSTKLGELAHQLVEKDRQIDEAYEEWHRLEELLEEEESQ
ncbi:MAG: ABC-F family ATP-binding cassette domain-containing protein [Anaerovoracaceae bacterium]|nr:ABC-F family ATP-binding cassette domain-containing protein [Anaerovoracaceae bacterium]